MPAGSAQPAHRPGAEAFTSPASVCHRRYEALRAYFCDGLTAAQAGALFGYTRWAMVDLIRQWRAGQLDLFAPEKKPGPAKGTAPARDRVRGQIIDMRRDEDLSAYEISRRLAAAGTPLNRNSVGEILAEEGFGRLLRGPAPGGASVNPGTAGRDNDMPSARVIDFRSWPAEQITSHAGLLLALPDLAGLDLPRLAAAAGYPGTRAIPAVSWLLTLLALKLTRTRRVSHVDDLLADPANALFAGMAVLPKKSALTGYSYRLSHDHQQKFLAALDTQMISAGLATADQAVFDLDFHAVMHWGRDPVLEKHYVPTRSQRARSVLTFFAQDSGTHNLVYGNADISKATQNREVIAFCDHWKQLSGTDPAMLVMDQKVTTHAVLGELHQRGIRFLTLRMRSASLMRHIEALKPADYKTITLDRPGPHNKPRVHEDKAVRLSGYPGTARQLVVTGLGRDNPTVIITNDDKTTIRNLISQYARRMTIEQRLAEIIGAFSADALSSAVNLNVDLDITLCVLAQATIASLRSRLPGYAAVTPETIQRRFLETPGKITTTKDAITIQLGRCAYSPTLRKADLPDTPIPWLGGRTIRYQIA